MNSIFFLIPLLLVGVPFAFGDIEKGANYDRELISVNPDNSLTYKWTSQPERILNNGVYEDYIFTDMLNALQMETQNGSVTLDKTTCGFSFHSKGLINENPNALFTDSITPFNSVVDLYSWNEITQISNATCEAYFDESNNSLVAKHYAANIGFIEYKYIYVNGQWKTQLEVTNLTSLTDRVFGFDQTIDLNRDTVSYGGGTKNLDNFNDQTFDRAWLESGNNQGKVIDLLNGVNFDFDLGFENLDSVSVEDSGANKSKLIFHYMRNNDILLPNETLIIDPEYTLSESDDKPFMTDQASGANCPTGSNIGAGDQVLRSASGDAGGRCFFYGVEFDISSIGDTDTIDQIVFETDIGTSLTIPLGCDIIQLADMDLSLISIGAFRTDITAGSAYVSNDSFCSAVGVDRQSGALGTTANSDLTTHLTSDDLFSLGFRINNYDSRDGVAYHATFTNSQLIVTYNSAPNPDAVDDLASTDITDTTVDLSWTEPNLNTGNLTGYQINYTTPWSNNPNTVITNNTETSDVTSQISGLTQFTDYSFRIGVWTEGYNGTGNVLNITTLEDFALANYTVGSFDFNATNDNIIQMFFERQDINDTALFLNVTYPNTYDLRCDFDYEFANINQTYSNLSNTTISASAVESSFQFIDVDNEIVRVYCWDASNPENDGYYLLTQTSFPLVQQIDNFRNGTYGTAGQVGILDLVTLMVIIFSFIGFNRVNEAVGGIFTVAILGVTAYFGIIELSTVIFGGIAIVLMLIIVTVRKT